MSDVKDQFTLSVTIQTPKPLKPSDKRYVINKLAHALQDLNNVPAVWVGEPLTFDIEEVDQ